MSYLKNFLKRRFKNYLLFRLVWSSLHFDLREGKRCWSWNVQHLDFDQIRVGILSVRVHWINSPIKDFHHRRTEPVWKGGGGGGLRSVAGIFYPLLAPNSSGFARILHVGFFLSWWCLFKEFHELHVARTCVDVGTPWPERVE